MDTPQETSEMSDQPGIKQPWLAPDVEDMDVGKNTYNGGPTFLDTGGFS
jgi:hypothetical protein